MLSIQDLRARVNCFPRMETTIELAQSLDWKLSIEDHNTMLRRMIAGGGLSKVKPEKLTQKQWKAAEKRLMEAQREFQNDAHSGSAYHSKSGWQSGEKRNKFDLRRTIRYVPVEVATYGRDSSSWDWIHEVYGSRKGIDRWWFLDIDAEKCQIRGKTWSEG